MSPTTLLLLKGLGLGVVFVASALFVSGGGESVGAWWRVRTRTYGSWIVDEFDARRAGEQCLHLDRIGAVPELQVHALGVADEHRHARAGGEHAQVGQPEDLAALVDELELLLRGAVVADNLRKGAATNAVQILEALVERGRWS